MEVGRKMSGQTKEHWYYLGLAGWSSAGLGSVKGVGCRCRKVDSVPSVEKSELKIKGGGFESTKKGVSVQSNPESPGLDWVLVHIELRLYYNQILKYSWAVYLLHMMDTTFIPQAVRRTRKRHGKRTPDF